MWGPAKGSTTVQDNNDGTYFVSYICNTSGIYHVDIRLGGYAVLVSSVWGDVSCTSGGIDPGCCTVEGGGLDTAVAGSKAAFTISAFDTHGTPKQFGGDLFVLKATETPDLPRRGGGRDTHGCEDKLPPRQWSQPTSPWSAHDFAFPFLERRCSRYILYPPPHDDHTHHSI